MINQGIVERMLAETIIKMKLEALTVEVTSGMLTAVAAKSQFDSFCMDIAIKFSREVTAQDVNICQN